MEMEMIEMEEGIVRHRILEPSPGLYDGASSSIPTGV